MKAGRSPEEALAGLVAADPQERVRQVGMVDSEGRAAAHTGAGCVRECGHLVGDGYAVQANMMASETVWGAMAQAFEAAEGTLAHRLVAALEAAEAEGGDFRGAQSAALLVVEAEPTGFAWKGRVSNLRVEDHPDPVCELRRLLEMEEDYRNERADHLREKDRHWIAAWKAAHEGDPDRARALVQPLFDAHPNWRDAVRAAGERGDFPGWERVLE